jgi:hypothetical protein
MATDLLDPQPGAGGPGEPALQLTRRALFGGGALGLGAAALGTLLAGEARAAEDRPVLTATHRPPAAKRVIYLLQNGAPSHVDLFDYKPGLKARMGEEIPPSVQGGQRLSTMTAGQVKRPLLPNITEFGQHGQSGAWICSFMPHTARIADELCIVRSMYTNAINHAPAITHFLTGAEQPGRPSLGAWLSYGLGSETQELPTFVVMTSRDKEASCGQIFYEHYWSSGFLPTRHQGVKFRGNGDPVLYLSNPPGVPSSVRRGLLDDLARLNRLKLQSTGDPEIATRISQYEMAYRMQASVPDLTDVDREPARILEMYGPDVRKPGSFAYNCLLARRLIERGVRYVQLFHAGWDQHRNLTYQLEVQCRDTDQPSAALVMDLKQRGLLDDTLVIWGGEFGRTVFLQGQIEDRRNWGRDHHPRCFSLWMAGGGVNKGTTYGETDDFAYNVARDPVSIHDFQATILHLLGIDHTRLTFRFQGRDYRLTDVEGAVVRGLVA